MATRSRLRRVNSTNRAGDVDDYERKQLLRRPDYPIHAHADSMFSTSSGFNNYRGMLNLCILLLALSNARLFLENIIKYGVLIDPISQITAIFHVPQIPNITLVLGVHGFILIAYYTERAIARNWISERTSRILHAINLLTLLIYRIIGNWISEWTSRVLHAINLLTLLIFPAVLIFTYNPNPAFSMFCLMGYSIAIMKLVSYAAVNQWCRDDIPASRRHRSRSVSNIAAVKQSNGSVGSNVMVKYPNNINLKDLYYFICAPTLCYELTFPKSPRIRKRFLIKRIIEALFLVQLIMGLVQQWIIPIITNTIKPLNEMNVSMLVERLLKLAIPNLFIWLMCFYWMFHSCLNVLAEVMRFADREFYRDWWNAETVDSFWQNWNVPVHRWASRHVFKPLIKRGYNKMAASLIVFLLSAFFHEYLVSIPLRMFRLWAFSAMLAQIPLAIFVAKYLHGHYGNMAVWLSIIIGQPIAILAYFHDYYVMNLANEPMTTLDTIQPIVTDNTTAAWSLLDLFKSI